MTMKCEQWQDPIGRSTCSTRAFTVDRMSDGVGILSSAPLTGHPNKAARLL